MADISARMVRDLRGIERKLRNKIIKAAQKETMKPLAADIKAAAPERTGELKAGIKTRSGKRKKGRIVTIVTISTPEDNPHAARVEFGTRTTPAEPFIRPTVARDRGEVIERYAASIDRQLEE